MVYILSYLLICWIVSRGKIENRKKHIILIFILGVIIMGFRTVGFTGDNTAYVSFFKMNSQLSLAESWERVVTGYDKDPFFYFLGNVFSKMGFTYRGWFVFIAIVFMGGFCRLMYEYSCDCYISMLILISVGAFYFAMTGLRQALAMGVCFFALDFALKKKLIPFVLFVLLAAAFHSSALIFIVVYLFTKFKPRAYNFIAIFAAALLALLMPTFIGGVVERLAWNDSLIEYAGITKGLTASGFIIQLCIFLFCYIFVRRDDAGNIYSSLEEIEPPFVSTSFNMLTAGLVIQAFAININNIFRMSMYFSFISAFLVPLVIHDQNEKNERTFYIAVTVALIAYMFVSSGGNFKYLTLFGD